MKKTIPLILALMVSLFVGLQACIAEDAGTVQKYGNIGRLSKLNITEDELNEVLKDIMVNSICDRYVFYDTLNDMVMALNRGDIVVLETDENTVRYIASRNDQIMARPPYMNPNMLLFSMLLRGEDTVLRDEISACVAGMKEDGTIEAMQQTYIENVIAGEEPAAIEFQDFPDAGRIRVAVTGDRPPMDYVSAGNEPIGFNTALIAEIAKRLGLNVDIVNVSCAARGISLATGICDIVFWMEIGDFENWDGASFEDQPENTIVTDPYLSVPLAWAVFKDSPVANVYRNNAE